MRHPRNVLHLIETGGPGGAETVFRNIVTGLPPDRWSSAAVVPVEGWLSHALTEAAVAPLILGGDLSAWSTVKTIRRLISDREVHLVHAHMLSFGVYAALATSNTAIPVVCTIHGLPDIGDRGLRSRLKLAVVSRPKNRIVFVSNQLRDAVIRTWTVSKAVARVIHNGVDTSVVPRSGSTREELGVGEGEFLVGAIGNIRPAKDYGNLLRAFRLVRDQGCPARLIVVGEGSGESLERLLATRSELRLDDVVTFTGFRSDVPELLSTFDLYVSSSSTEGFSLTVVEALLAGTPVVATRSGGPEEILDDRSTGLLVPPRDPRALSDAILEVYRNAALGREMAARGRGEALSRFSDRRMVAAYDALYVECLGARDE